MKAPFQVLIVEDEPEICRVLAMIIDSHPAFKVAFCATNGCEALDYLKSQPAIDVLLTDIRMPGMDGLTLLEHMRNLYMKPRTIIISGYNSFEYAQRSIKYGVSEYLLKPIQPKDCIAMLNALATDLDKQKDSSFDLTCALSRHTKGLPNHTLPVYLLAVCPGNFPFCAASASLDENLIRNILYNANISAPSRQNAGYKGGIFYLLCEYADDADARAALGRLGNEMCARLGFNYYSCILALMCCSTDEDICTSASRLNQQMRRSALFGQCTVLDLTIPAAAAKPIPVFDAACSLDKTMLNAICSGDYSGFATYLKEKLDMAVTAQIPSAALLERVKFQYACTAQRIFLDMPADSLTIPYDWETQTEQIFSTCQSLQDLYNGLNSLFCSLFEALRQVKASRSIMQEIERYIEYNYTEHITNQTLARQFGFVPSYISKIFRDYKGLSPCDYLTQVRIKQAQRIIRSAGDANFNEIAAAVGFSDSSYFSKLFKKLVGVTPTEYKNQL